MKKPGNNWAPMRDLVPGSHISLSVRKDRLHVNLNNEKDSDRRQYDRLHAAKEEIERLIGCKLIWEKKDDTKKSAVRAELIASYQDHSDWDHQFQWAMDMMRRFEQVFRKRL